MTLRPFALSPDAITIRGRSLNRQEIMTAQATNLLSGPGDILCAYIKPYNTMTNASVDPRVIALNNNEPASVARFYTMKTPFNSVKQLAVSNFPTIGAGGSNIAVIDGDDNLWTYGSFSTTSSGFTESWTRVTTFDGNAKKVCLGMGWYMVLTIDGYVYTHGTGTNYALGTGSTSNVTGWTQILSGCTDIACRYQTGFAIQAVGTLLSWGNNTGYATGLGTTSGATITPTSVGGTDWVGATVFGAGSGASANGAMIVQKAAGTWWNWGTSTYVTNGSGAVVNNTTPTQLSGWPSKLASKILVTNSQTVVVFQDGTLYGCGYNAGYFFGMTNQTNQTSLNQIGTDTDWKDAFYNYNAATSGTVYYIKTDGSVWQGGLNQASSVQPFPMSQASPLNEMFNTGYKLSASAVTSTGWNGLHVVIAG